MKREGKGRGEKERREGKGGREGGAREKCEAYGPQGIATAPLGKK